MNTIITTQHMNNLDFYFFLTGQAGHSLGPLSQGTIQWVNRSGEENNFPPKGARSLHSPKRFPPNQTRVKKLMEEWAYYWGNALLVHEQPRCTVAPCTYTAWA